MECDKVTLQPESPENRAKRIRQVERNVAVYWIIAAIQRERLNKVTPLRY
jgi:hypothetical protein